VVFAKSGEAPNLPYRISFKHQEIGTGVNRRRRSVVRVDRTSLGDIDTEKVVTTSAYTVLDAPVGNLTDTTEMQGTVANLIALIASDGSDTTVKFDGSGTAAAALINGSL
jgi:hypothetical protein